MATPYGMVNVTEDGRRITFQLWDDVRQSIHHKALFSYYQQLKKRGIERINVDHLDIVGLDRSLDLKRGKAKLDMVYQVRGKLTEIELKTHREVGLDITARQLSELARYCQNLIVVVPRIDTENMYTILDMIGLRQKITVDTYELLEDERDFGNDRRK